METARHSHDTEVHSDVRSSGTHDSSEKKYIHRNFIQSKTAKAFLQFVIGIRMAGLSLLAVVALGMAFLFPQTVQAQEYPWCLSREGYLYCFYKTEQQCQWTSSGIGGCALSDANASTVDPKSR